MNKKGMSLGFQIVLVVLFLLIVFGVVSGAFGLSFAKVKGFWVEIYDSMSGQIDDLKKSLGLSVDEPELTPEQKAGLIADAEEKRESFIEGRDRDVREMSQLLLDAANFISGKNRELTINAVELKDSGEPRPIVVKGTTGGVKDPGEAIKNYVEYYKRCEVAGTGEKGCLLEHKNIKTKILNALREEVFTSVLKGEALPDINSYNFEGLVSSNEFESTVLLARTTARIYGGYTDAADFWRTYNEDYKDNDKINFNNGLHIFNRNSYLVQNGEDACYYALEAIEALKRVTSTNLGFEIGHKILGVEDYTFIEKPYNKIKKLCEGKGTTKPESAPESAPEPESQPEPEESAFEDKCDIGFIHFELQDGTSASNIGYVFSGRIDGKWLWGKNLGKIGAKPTNNLDGLNWFLNRNSIKLINKLNENPTKGLEGLKLLLDTVRYSNGAGISWIYQLMPSLIATYPRESPGNEVKYIKLSNTNLYFVVKLGESKTYYKFISTKWYSHGEKDINFSPVDEEHYLYKEEYYEGVCLLFSENLQVKA